MERFYYWALLVIALVLSVTFINFDDKPNDIDVAEKVASQLSNEQLTKGGDQNNQPVDAKFKPHLDIENHTSKANNIEDVKSSLKNAVNRTINQTKIQQTKPRLAQSKQDQLNKLDEKFSSTKATNYTVNNAGQLSGIYPNYTQTFADADQFVEESRDLLDVNTHSTLTKIKDDCTTAEQCISRYKRNAFGFPILQDDFVVSLNNGYVVSVMGAMSLPNVNPEHLNSSNTLTNADIEFMLKNEFGEQYTLKGEVVYGIYDAKVVAVPAYKASVSSGFEGYDVIINARNQQIVTKVPHVMHVNAEGQDLQDDTYQFKAVQSDSSYVMQDDRFPLNSFTAIFTMQDLTSDEWFADPFYSLIQSNSLTSGWDPSAVSVLSHFDSLVTYFNENLNYQVKVPGNSPMTILVNMNEENAFALTNTMGFGKTATSNFANSRDVVAHELTHTIISATSNLVYSDQSGAMNESFADLFGTLASDDGNWLLGEDIYDDGRYIRNMKNPSDESVTGGRQPFHFDQYVYGGSVHLNSGIPNRFFYLMAEGNTQYAIGRTKTGIIAFDVLKSLNKDAGFIDFFQAMKAQASFRYGTESNEVAAVIEAGVGIGFTDKEINKVEVETSYIPKTANAVLFLSPNDTSLSLGNYDLNIQFYDAETPSYDEDAVVKISNSAAYSRPSAGVSDVYGNNLLYSLYKKTDGSIGYYYYNLDSDEQGETVYLSAERASSFNNISADRTFTQLASSLTGIYANTIQIYNIEASEQTLIKPYAPSFTEGEKGLPVEVVDVVEFDPTGRFVAFDYLTSSPGGEEFWSIGILEIDTGYISHPFAKLPANISVGYPSFSNLNSDIITFDALFSDSGESAAYIINLKTGNITAIANTKAIESEDEQYSLPTLTSNDNAAIFSIMNTSGDYIGLMPLNDSYEPDTENFIYLNPVNEAYYLRSIPFSAYQDTLTLNQDETTFDFGDVTVNQSDEICLTNESTHPIKINNTVIDQGVILSALPNYYNGGEKVCASFTIDVDRLALGLFNLGIELTHNGTSEPIIYTFSGNKLLDSDGDGIADVTDSDDDNDGVADELDAYPLIAIGDLVDTDSDGAPDTCDEACIELGMLADTDDDNDGVEDTTDAYPLISIGDLVDTDSDGAPDTCDEACLVLGMKADRVGIPAYTYLEQPEPQFATLTPTAKVIVTGSQGDNFFDIARYVNDVTLVGQSFLVSGSTNVDGLMVMPGVKYNLTNLKGGVDAIYFSGPFAEYADSILLDPGSGVMQLSRLTDIGEEIVQFIATASAADVLVFTDGAISTSAIKDAIINETPMDNLVLDTSVSALDTKPISSGTVKHIVLDNNGAGVMALGPNISTLISGSSGIDQIYVPAGSVVDASNLKSGQDEIYVEGNRADYYKSFDDSGNIVMRRDVIIETEVVTESITVASGGNVATNDLIIFADQQVDTATIKLRIGTIDESLLPPALPNLGI